MDDPNSTGSFESRTIGPAPNDSPKLVVRQLQTDAHNPKVAGSSPAPATNMTTVYAVVICFQVWNSHADSTNYRKDECAWRSSKCIHLELSGHSFPLNSGWMAVSLPEQLPSSRTPPRNSIGWVMFPAHAVSRIILESSRLSSGCSQERRLIVQPRTLSFAQLTTYDAFHPARFLDLLPVKPVSLVDLCPHMMQNVPRIGVLLPRQRQVQPLIGLAACPLDHFREKQYCHPRVPVFR